MVYFISWNVDGYSDSIHLWLRNLLEPKRPDLVFLSETKRTRANLELYFNQFTDYNYIINPHIPAQYHGVAMLIRKSYRYVEIPIQMNIPTRKDSRSDEAATGRIIALQLSLGEERQVNVIGSYTPNSGRDLEELGEFRVPSRTQKLDYRVNQWDPTFYQVLEILRANKPTVWMGDINVALSDLDVSHPVMMSRWAGFTLKSFLRVRRKDSRREKELLCSAQYWELG